MKTQFLTRNVCIGALMVLVLTLGVQGVCEALTITQTSSPVESKPSGSSFDLTFTVGLKGNTVAYHPDYPRRRISADDHDATTTPPYTYIDAQGYEVTYIGETSRSYRNTTGTPAGTLAVDPRPAYSTNSDGSAADPAAAGTPSGTYLVDTSGNVYDTDGDAVYVQTGTGTRDDPDTPANENAPWRYTRAKATPNAKVADASALHDYNDEAIGITITQPTAGTGTLELKNRGYTFPSVTKPGTEADYDGGADTYSLKERVDIGLPSSITLVYTGASVGTHTIEIWDATPTTDFPLVGGPSVNRPRSAKTFTIRVTPATTDVETADDIIPDSRRVPVEADEPQQVSALFMFPLSAGSGTPDDPSDDVPKNYRILYKVFRGNGKLYVGTREQQFTTPAQTLLVHQASPVWINMEGTSNEVHLSFAGEDRSTARARVVYEYRGQDLPGRNVGGTGSGTGGTGGTGAVTTRGSLNISVSGTGNTRTVTVTALNAAGTAQPGISVVLNVNNGASLSRTSGPTPLSSTLTLPAAAGDYLLTATTTADFTGDSETITITLPGNLGLLLIGDQVNGAQTVQVTARNAVGSLETTAVLVTLSGAGISRTVTVTGSQNIPISLPTTSGTLVASATGYNSGSVILPARATGSRQQQQTQQQQQQQPTTTAGVADSIEIDGDRQLSGTVNQVLRLRARVLDANDRGVSDVRVTFKVLAPGKGRLSQRGNGRAVIAETDRNGYATANLTPLGGNLIVEAKAAGVSAPVSFIIDIEGDTGSATTGDTTAPRTYNVRDEIPISLGDTLTFRGSRTLNGTTYTCVGSGECVISYGTVVKGQIQASPEKTTTPGTGDTPRTTEINPVVHINASNRPPMVWADGGTIYALVGAEVQAFISGVEGAMNIAIAGNKVYWTEKTGENSGTINAANLDGSSAKELKSIMAVPMGIAVDITANKVYWTNSRGRIQSLNADGSGIVENVRQNLPSPMDLAVARGNLYWTQYDATSGAGSIGIANPTGRGTPKYISTGSDTPGSLTIAGNKVYWTERTGTSSGTVNSANLTGNGATQLASIRAVPMGIAVDTARSKLYWTNSRGRIQSADLNGSKIQNIVDGLGMPGDMVLSNSIKAPTAATTPSTAKSTTPAVNKYDINGDGTVDSKDSDALIVAVAAGITTAKYDVTGDGKVDINDVVAVNANRSAGAASAPTLLGTKLSALEIETLQEQIDLLIATGDRSPAAMKTLIYLQQLIAMARPEKTQLLANYPNPFNPETWMPYELATDTDVRLTIYNAQGVVIRVLQLGQQSAGYYTDRERAAYWDGRNALGERVASGIYFYQLETDDMSSLRKMVILK